jgi:hypothetical protein
MRLNTSIAILVIAGLSLLPAALLAKQASPATHKSQKQVHRKSTEKTVAKTHKKRRRTRPQQVDAPEPITVHRVRDAAPARRSEPRLASDENGDQQAGPRKATSEDFIRAAQGHPSDDTPAAATGVSHPPDNDEETPRSGAPAKAAIKPSTRPSTDSQIVAEDSGAPVFQPTLYNKRGRLIMPRPLRGSHEILVRQNLVADREGLDRIKDDDDLTDMRVQGLLVPLPASTALEVDDRLPANRRYSRPWTAQFLTSLARAHYARFHSPLQVNSAVRTVEFQEHLQRTNGNAAPAEGETASPHLTGQAIDIAKHGLSLTEIAWLRGYLLPLVQQGKIDVEEEFQQSCFHISVYKKYLPATGTPRREIASGRHTGTSALAAAMP